MCAYSAICSSNVNVIETQQVSNLLSLLPFDFYHESGVKTELRSLSPFSIIVVMAGSEFKNTYVVCGFIINSNASKEDFIV